MKQLTVLALLSALVFVQPVWAGDAAAGKGNYGVCLACHGANGEGNKAVNAPALAGLPESYLVRQLNNYKQGIRGTNPKDAFGAQMRPMAMTMTNDAAVANVSAYIASLPAPKHSATLGGNADKGKALYSTCLACHGMQGEGNESLNAPPLATLQDWYIARQLQNFKAGIRGTDPKDAFGAQMRPMAMVLPDDQAIKDVSAYIVSLGK